MMQHNSLLQNPKRLRTLMSADTRNALRDPTLLFGICFALLPTLILPIFRQDISAWSQNTFGLTDLVGWAMPTIITSPAILVGWIVGFLFLEDRDEKTLLAVDITPVGKTGFLQYRALFTALITALITLINVIVFIPGRGVVVGFSLIIMISILAIFVSFIFPAIARNKVEGLALTKIVNFLILIPLLALMPSPFRFAAGIFPSFWIGELLNPPEMQTLPLWVTIILGLAVHLGALHLIYRVNQLRAG